MVKQNREIDIVTIQEITNIMLDIYMHLFSIVCTDLSLV